MIRMKLKPLYFQYFKGKDSIVLAPNENFNDITTSSRGLENPLSQWQFILSDSIKITYGDTLSIFHESVLNDVNQDLRKL
jgi:hypothetical protein